LLSASNFFAMPVIASLIRSGTSWRDTPASAIGERTKCFGNAERKLRELMESWDYLLAEEITSGREDHDYLRTCPEIIESTFERVKYGFTTELSYHMLWW
jgi:hypothetical protein